MAISREQLVLVCVYGESFSVGTHLYLLIVEESR